MCVWVHIPLLFTPIIRRRSRSHIALILVEPTWLHMERSGQELLIFYTRAAHSSTFTTVVDKRGVGLTFAASFGEFIDQNDTETHVHGSMHGNSQWPQFVRSSYTSWHHSVCMWPKPNLCLVPAVWECSFIFVIVQTEFILVLNNMWLEPCQGPALNKSFLLKDIIHANCFRS